LDLSNLLNFIVVDDQNFSINLSVRKLLLGLSTGVWLFEADESVLVTRGILLWLKSNVLELTIFGELLSNLSFSPAIWEVLNVKIDSLLGALVSDSFHEFFLFSLGFAESMSNVKLKSISSWGHFSVHESIDGFVHTSWSIGLIFFSFVIIANETVLSNFILEDNKGFDSTEWKEEFFYLSLGHLSWDVLEIKIID
jgi:hypothetical protein